MLRSKIYKEAIPCLMFMSGEEFKWYEGICGAIRLNPEVYSYPYSNNYFDYPELALFLPEPDYKGYWLKCNEENLIIRELILLFCHYMALDNESKS